MKNIFRHGDIPIYEGEFSVDGLKKLTHKGDFAFAFGETTGHRHRVLVKDPKDLDVFEIEGGFIMTLRTEADVVHEEHKTLKLTPGTYRFGKEREKDWFSLSVRRVID